MHAANQRCLHTQTNKLQTPNCRKFANNESAHSPIRDVQAWHIRVLFVGHLYHDGMFKKGGRLLSKPFQNDLFLQCNYLIRLKLILKDRDLIEWILPAWSSYS